jgi:hypothetical protein
VHDISALEASGIPAVFVASSVFVEAAQAQSQALGFAAPSVFVAHPIQDRTDAEMAALADDVVEQVMERLRA